MELEKKIRWVISVLYPILLNSFQRWYLKQGVRDKKNSHDSETRERCIEFQNNISYRDKPISETQRKEDLQRENNMGKRVAGNAKRGSECIQSHLLPLCSLLIKAGPTLHASTGWNEGHCFRKVHCVVTVSGCWVKLVKESKATKEGGKQRRCILVQLGPLPSSPLDQKFSLVIHNPLQGVFNVLSTALQHSHKGVL